MNLFSYQMQPRLHGLAALCMLAILSGCAHDYATEASFGRSVSEAVARQSLNPNGTIQDGVTPGMDGFAAKASIDRYQAGFERPAGMGNVLAIGVGQSAGSVSGQAGLSSSVSP